MSSFSRRAFVSGRRACLVAAGAAVLMAGGMMTTSASGATSEPPPGAASGPAEGAGLAIASGINYLPARVNLQPTASGAWVGTGLAVTLPHAGTYALDLNVRTRLTGVPPVNAYVVGRLWNTTAGALVPNSERLLSQILDTTPLAAGAIGKNETAPISEYITVNGPTTIRLEVQRTNASGASTAADVWTDANGRSSFRYTEIP
ncbi:hypothetical protein Ssi03_50320 [Sphaerisporangium siamense]|uniref:Uncharacterized protein n=1 Tax=Sphaerisporangium siamense TaxID=795645 RepID=A0A7W7D3H0_9ACTN|nr:hypothetical protein [Sphaerisporangium siamense]MBB4699629.1 hypothetical protein [Sphaerisporangium siamense]GII87042.1 hypothetical protein Ssi03_50320 [Sphaerisporangium siamense]